MDLAMLTSRLNWESRTQPSTIIPSKEELVCAVIQRYRDRFQLWINNSRVKNLSPWKAGLVLSIYTDARADNGKVCLAARWRPNSFPARFPA